MDNRMDNLTLVPKWISRVEQDKILQSRCSETHLWDRRRRIRRQENNEDDEMLSDNESSNNNNNNAGRREDKSERRRGENSLYWKAITQLLANETEEVMRG